MRRPISSTNRCVGKSWDSFVEVKPGLAKRIRKKTKTKEGHAALLIDYEVDAVSSVSWNVIKGTLLSPENVRYQGKSITLAA